MKDMPLAFANLPLFATDAEIASAIVGKDRAERWRKERLPTLAAQPGFPPVDQFHNGRAVPLIWKFYQHYLHIEERGNSVYAPPGRENRAAWKSSRTVPSGE